jgi:acetolactate synthase-1/2/3 large subunit
MLVLGCGIRRDTRRAFQLHDVDQQAMVAPVVKATFRPEDGSELYTAIRHACEVAREGAPGPVFVEVPANLYLFTHEVELPPQEEPGAFEPDVPTPDEALLVRAAKLVREARRPLIYVGAGAVGSAEEVKALAELLEAPVSTTFQGKGIFPEEHPLFLWPGFGASSPPFVREIAAECDLTLAIGCRFSEVGTGSWGMEPPSPLIHVDIDADALGRNFPADLALVSDAGAFLRALHGLLGEEPRNEDAALRERIRSGHARVWREWLENVGGERVTPAHLLRTAQRVFGSDTVFATDSGNGTFLAVECLRLEAPRKFLAPVDYSCMGYAVPAALGAKLANPDAPVVALAGDGAFLMTGLEMLTAATEGIGVVVLVLRDRELAQIAQFQATATSRKVSSSVHEYDLERLADGMGVPFLSIDTDQNVESTLREAERLGGEGTPVLVEVAIDYARRTYFTEGVLKSTLLRLPLKDQVRFLGRAVARKITG